MCRKSMGTCSGRRKEREAWTWRTRKAARVRDGSVGAAAHEFQEAAETIKLVRQHHEKFYAYGHGR